ncbi:MAG: class I SAM-dependent methyltransferase [Ruminococcus sp.]|nr:class I SAM-dependent methyltransferase [Ruminococcus sp.]
MQLKLENKRLLTCAKIMSDSVKTHRRVADIGTDHGYLTVYLVQSGICESAIAADINSLPLESAKRTVGEYGLEDRVELVLSDGLKNVPADGITDIVCAGMGGELIARILSEYEWVKGATLILQPMTKADELRKWLFINGFFIESELPCRDGRFVYTIIRARYAPDRIDYECTPHFLAVGKILPDTKDGADYFRVKAAQLRRAGEGMTRSKDKKEQGGELLALSESLTRELEEQL